jgi:hypothetical protein
MFPAFEATLHARQNGIDQPHARANEQYGQSYDHACSLAPRTCPGPYHGGVALRITARLSITFSPLSKRTEVTYRRLPVCG